MNKNYFFIAIINMFVSSNTYSFQMDQGVMQGDSNWDEYTQIDRENGYYPIAAVESDETGIVFIYDGALGKTDYANGRLLQGWSLTRWEYELSESNIESIYHLGGASVDQSNLARDIDSSYFHAVSADYPSMGCLSLSPLRYGDVSNTGENEVGLFLSAASNKSDFILFSPEYERIVFSVRYLLQDYISVDFTDYQYAMGFRQQEGTAGVRIYSKMYQGDFDADGNADFLVWRKHFDSLEKTDSEIGFSLTAQTFTHYERDLEAQALLDTGITGEYLPQETDEATIQTWLAENDLTWSAGYPSVSECEGEEGELIPEMHDALLNDPDVLQ